MKVMICANLAKERSRKAAADACAKLNEIGFLPMIEKQYENIIKVDNAVYAETDSLITDCDMFMTELFSSGDRKPPPAINSCLE